MDRKLHVTALAGILFLLIHTVSAYAQNQARADIVNAQGKKIGTASLRETKDGVVMTISVTGGFPRGSMPFISTRSESAKVRRLRVPVRILIRSVNNMA